ncbi:LuxR family transcriptional regulator [Paracoccus yeei]|uniref:helix-turn-helix transcriptional regulator n=1 Tax=Paracoccus yeei TaxID=147645 RepID=UPI003BF8DA81
MASDVPLHTQDELISCLHRAVFDPAVWREFAIKLDRSLGGTATTLHGVDYGLRKMITTTVGDVDTDTVSKFTAYYQAINPFSAFAIKVHPGRAQLFSTMIPDVEVLRSEFYNDFMRLNGDLLGGGAIKASPVGGRSLVVSVTAPRRQREITEPRAIRLLSRLGPHISHAFQVSEVLAGYAAQSTMTRSFEEYPSSPDGGVIITDTDRLVAWADESIFSSGSQVAKIDILGRLVFMDEAVENWARAFSKNRPGQKAPAPPQIKITICGKVWTIRVLTATTASQASPIYPAIFRGINFMEQQLIFILSPDARMPSREMRLAKRYGLTAAETAVALRIAEGLTTSEIAEERSVSLHTVRNQVRAVMDKMDVRHRGGLASLVSGLSRR